MEKKRFRFITEYRSCGLHVCYDGLRSGSGWSKRPVRAVEQHASVDRDYDDHSRRIPGRRHVCVRGSSWEMLVKFRM